MITVRAKARGGIVVTSRMLLDNEFVAEFEAHNDVVENMAKQAGFTHMLEMDCQGMFTNISQTFNRIVTMDELEEFEKRHEAWLKDVKGAIETEEMAAQQEREREYPRHECPYPGTTSPKCESLIEEDIEFLKGMSEILNELDEDGDELPLTAEVRVRSLFPIARIGNRLLKVLIKDAIKKYVS